MNEVFNEDCNEGMKQYPNNYFDLAVVDPPYGIGMDNRKGKPLKSNNRKKDTRFKGGNWDDSTPNKDYFNELFRVSENQIIWGGNYFTDKLPVSRGWAFWDKKPIVGNYSDGELAWTSFDKVLKRIVIMWNGKIRNGIEKGYIAMHPTQKPIKLYEWIYKNYLPDGGKVIDTHLGSGSNWIAAEKTGNIDFTGYEIDKDYFDASVKRYNQFKSQLCLSL